MESSDQQPKAKSGSKGIQKPSKGKRRRSIVGRIIVFLILVSVIALFGWAEMQRREAVNRLQETEQRLEEIQTSTQQSGEERAQQVLESVRKHIDIPSDPEPTVATIVDVERLRESSTFYEKADNGDSLVITENRAILYDVERDIIVDVVPVRINQDQQDPDNEQSPSPSPGDDPNASPSGSPSGSPDPDSENITSSPSPDTQLP